VIVYSPMASGLLTGAMTRESAPAALPPDDFSQPQVRNFAGPRLSKKSRNSSSACGQVGVRHGAYTR